MAFHGAQRQFEFDFVVAPGANPAPIGFLFTGAQGMKTDDSGNLVISSAAGDVLLHKPVAYQERQGARQAVDARFLLKSGNKVSFELGDYDRSRELVIDPSVSYEYSTYLGGTDDDEGYAIAFDSSGNAYVTGQTASPTFPGASGTLPDAAAVFVTKIDADGSSLLYSTYVGGTGTGTDSGNGIAVDASGDAFVAGGTTSTTFPTTSVAFQKTLKGAGNAFVFELVPDGTSLTYCTYLGGSGNDVALGIALDSAGNAYPVGETSSTDFPTSPNPLQGYVAGSKASGFVTKLNSLGTALVYSTYLGGSSAGDFVGAVALDSSDNVYVTGQTFSSSFPTTTGAFQPKCGSCSGGDSDAFVTKLSPTGSALVYSTFLGGSGTDLGDGIAVDSSGSAYVTGLTGSTDFPLQSALQTALGGADDAFVTKLNPAGSALVYSTFLGGSQPDGAVTFGASIAVDSSGYAYLTGQTSSTDFPLQSALQSTYGGGSTDAFVSEINSTGSALAFSTYLGGSQDEDDSGSYGAIAVDSVGANIYVTGSTLSINFPTFPTQSPYQKNNAGGTDAFVAKYAQSQSFSIVATTPAAVAPGTSGISMVTLTAFHGYSSPVNLSCSVSGTGSPLPACSTTSFSPGKVTPTAVGATSTLTITTTAANAAMFVPRKVFYAMWLPIAGMSLVGIGFGSAHSRRRKVLGFLMIGMVVAGLLLMPACG
ncbi:MAG: SBBP repeat-containing protein, partial [Candidatus Sulfotelmatobacter sp.]